jgi:hypothetical protein
LNDLSPLQMREFMLDSEVTAHRVGDVIFEKNDPGLVAVRGSRSALSRCASRGKGRAHWPGIDLCEVGLISGRKRGATIRAAEDSILVEVSRTAALKLMASVPGGQARG